MTKSQYELGKTVSRRLLIRVILLGGMVSPCIWADDNHKTRIFSPDSRPVSVALTYADWSARWWQWALTIPVPHNPTLDPTGADCRVNQSGRVFFLAGTFLSGPAVRSCTVPAGKVLFFPIINAECSNVEPAPFHGDNEAELRTCAQVFMNGTSLPSLKLSIDGAPVSNLAQFRVASPLFTYTVPPNNLLGVAEGVSPISVSDGFWIMVRLSPGNHVIHFEGAIVSGPGAGTTQNVTYTLKVKGDD